MLVPYYFLLAVLIADTTGNKRNHCILLVTTLQKMWYSFMV